MRFCVLRGRRRGLGNRWMLIVFWCMAFLVACVGTSLSFSCVWWWFGVFRGRRRRLINRWVLVAETAGQARQVSREEARLDRFIRDAFGGGDCGRKICN